ncbi:hypothetical protein [Cyanobium sp. FACHB-13342]|uniref:hypothetical protein n=1 Tax=Cyanobium sp. FACHB-13342 TaxID=2692793 RepID=UPI0018EF813C|nr:hypothetical protein [Cyanobium sp. FACHB-13342]
MSVAESEPRAQLRLQSIGWALAAGVVAGLVNLLSTVLGPGLSTVLEPALRSAGCGFFYGLLAFHLQRVDPDDSHLQAGLVGAVCGIRSLGAPLELVADLSTVMMELIRGWLPLWLPLIGSALVLHSAQRLAPGLRPARRP